jgi:hypothetical protein
MIFEKIIPKKIQYTILHKKAYKKIEKQLLGKNTLRGYLHDLDKIFMLIFLPRELVHKIHRKFSRHHNRARNRKDYIDMVIDWECARFTKADKPLTAVETLYAYFPEKEKDILPLLKEFKLVPEAK